MEKTKRSNSSPFIFKYSSRKGLFFDERLGTNGFGSGE
jgi:hypothetical protein